MKQLDADYIIVGAGAMGLAFADALLSESEATIAVIDRYAQPGGHWTLAYPFVRLHQPSAGYGVNSRMLGNDVIDQDGWNAGLKELASSAEVCGYFDQVVRQTLLPSGRVSYFPMTEFNWDGTITSRVSGDMTRVSERSIIVDATYQNVEVPAMRSPPFAMADSVACVPPNGLVVLDGLYERFTIIGGGKTGIDACLWLLRQNVDPDRIRWIVPRDSWLVDRALTQPGPEFADFIGESMIATLQAIDLATSRDDLLARLEQCGRLIRLDPAVKPTMYRCATISQAELVQLRRIKDVVRLGRVKRLDPDQLTLEKGVLPTDERTLYVDCTADGLSKRPDVPVFKPGRITLQSVRSCQQVFSAALIGYVEANHSDLDIKNLLCRPISHPDTDTDFIRITIADAENELRWQSDDQLQNWLAASRLNWVRDLGPPPSAEPKQHAASMEVRRTLLSNIASKLSQLKH